jgi:hypothetical protein
MFNRLERYVEKLADDSPSQKPAGINFSDRIYDQEYVFLNDRDKRY